MSDEFSPPFLQGARGDAVAARPEAAPEIVVAPVIGRAGARPSRCGRNKLRPSRRQDGGSPCGGRGAIALPQEGVLLPR